MLNDNYQNSKYSDMVSIPLDVQGKNTIFSSWRFLFIFKLMEKRVPWDVHLKHKRDWKNALDTILEEGMQKGMEKGMQKGMEKGVEKGREEGREIRNREIAKNLKKSGVDLSVIAEATGLDIKEIEEI